MTEPDEYDWSESRRQPVPSDRRVMVAIDGTFVRSNLDTGLYQGTGSKLGAWCHKSRMLCRNMTCCACSYLNLSTLGFSDLGMRKAIVRNGLSGWYYRVLAPDVLTAGDSFTLEARPHPQWSIDRFN